ncbi:MAG: glycosyltransferase family 2 protein [Nitrososphaerota archaeon]|nr:glycosyltransferase family 2 protein [Nitrososphaerota archaeon]
MVIEKQPRVAIIVLNWNGLDDTIECLESLKKVIYQNYEVVVVDNGSEGKDVEVLRTKFGEYVHMIENDKNYGFCEGNNIGIRYALKNGADYVLLLNNDTIVAHDFLSELMKVADSNPKIGIVGPKIYYYRQPNRIWFAGGRISLFSTSSVRGFNLTDKGQFNRVDYVDFVSGSCVLIKRSVFETVGLLDPIYFFSMEDVDLCLRATQAGFRNVFVPSSMIWHKVFMSGVRNPHIVYYSSRNAVIFARKHCRVFRKASIRTVIATVIELTARSIRYRNGNIVLTMIKGLSAGIRADVESSKARRLA